MPLGKLIQLIHLSQQKCVQSVRLVPDHNDKGYGIIADTAGRHVYFSHEAVQNRFGFDDLRLGQELEFTLENAPYLRASSVRRAPAIVTGVLRPAA